MLYFVLISQILFCPFSFPNDCSIISIAVQALNIVFFKKQTTIYSMCYHRLKKRKDLWFFRRGSNEKGRRRQFMDSTVKTRVIKRNGEEVSFDLSKIISAISKANREVDPIHSSSSSGSNVISRQTSFFQAHLSRSFSRSSISVSSPRS